MRQEPELPSLRPWLGERSATERQTLLRLWELPESGPESVSAEQLLTAMTTPGAVAGVLARLRPADRAALARLQAEGGELPAHVLEREFGAVRDHRAYASPRAYLDALAGPPSATERLFVLGLIQQRRSRVGLAYTIPAELLPLLPAVPPRDRQLRLAPAEAPAEVHVGDPARFERALVGLLAAAFESPLAVGRDGALRRPSQSRAAARLAAVLPSGSSLSEQGSPLLGLLRHVAVDLGLLRRTRVGLRAGGALLAWLGRTPFERRRDLLEAWSASGWDELTALCGLRWRTPPLRREQGLGRRALLRLLGEAPAGQWWSLESWVAELRRIDPDFQRPDGIYTTWQLVDDSGHSLVGFEHWDEVEGALARAVVAGPLAWLGLVDLGGATEEGQPELARLTAWGAALLGSGEAPLEAEALPVPQANFSIFVPPSASPLVRFQLSRIAEWEGQGAFERFQLTREALTRAIDRGSSVEEIIEFLQRWSAEPLPQNVTYTLRQWAAAREELQLRPALLLEAADPLLLERLRRDRRVALPPQQQLDERRWAFAEADGRQLVEGLRDAGYGVIAELPAAAEPLSERDLAALLVCAEVVARVASASGLAHGASAALRRRLERLLSTPQRAAAARDAQLLAARLLGEAGDPRETRS